MTRLIVVTFFFLAVAFYELSGGAGFVAEERVAAAALPTETVTRADTGALASLTDLQEPAVAAALPVRLIQLQVAPEAVPVPEPEIEAVVEQVAAAAALDVRQVSAELVNMREGPGTDYAVMDKLARGTATEVLEVEASGWAHVRVIDTGLLGWVSAEYLAASNG